MFPTNEGSILVHQNGASQIAALLSILAPAPVDISYPFTMAQPRQAATPAHRLGYPIEKLAVALFL